MRIPVIRHGPEILDKGVRFHLWAPQAKSVELILDGSRPVQMPRGQRGMRQLVAPDAHPGSLYNFRIDGDLIVPDPASRFQPHGISGPSQVVQLPPPPGRFPNRRWETSIIYEMHVGAFTGEGTYAAAEAKLDYLRDMGFTSIQMMPVHETPGKRSWGYDGTLLYAPNAGYGTPQDLQHFVASAHERGLMVYLDVVYNHFGPEKNYLNDYARDFFTDRHQTAWGPAVNLEGPTGQFVRRFLIDNAKLWLQEYGFDGLRFDAVHALKDNSPWHFLYQMAQETRTATPGRRIHLILENENNQARYLERRGDRPRYYDAQWGDDFENALYVLLTHDATAYRAPFAKNPLPLLARALTENFAWQGEVFPLTQKPRGEPSAHLPSASTVFFVQNHDQVGNRPRGDRAAQFLGRARLVQALALLMFNPHPPMLFMGEEAAATTPFPYFANWHGDLAEKVREGRREEFSDNPEFSSPKKAEKIPDPVAPRTFDAAKLDWASFRRTHHRLFNRAAREIMRLRHRHIDPLIREGFKSAHAEISGLTLDARWETHKGKVLQIVTQFGDKTVGMPDLVPGVTIYDTEGARVPRRLSPNRLIVRLGAGN